MCNSDTCKKVYSYLHSYWLQHVLQDHIYECTDYKYQQSTTFESDDPSEDPQKGHKRLSLSLLNELPYK